MATGRAFGKNGMSAPVSKEEDLHGIPSHHLAPPNSHKLFALSLVSVYTETMLVITWDEPKRLKTLRERGLDFADLDEGYFLSSLVVPAKNNRMMAIGPFLDGTISVVFMTLGSEGISIISMRPASAKERKRYEEADIS